MNMPVITLLNGDPHLDDNVNQNIFKAVQTFIERSNDSLLRMHLSEIIIVQLVIVDGIGVGYLGVSPRDSNKHTAFFLFSFLLVHYIRIIIYITTQFFI